MIPGIVMPNIESPPAHWQLLNQRDLEEYIIMRKAFNEEVGKSRKGERLESFMCRLTRIRKYIERGDVNDWKRSLVCGIVFLQNSIAINIQQLKNLIGKCKSSINGSLQQLGYTALPQGRDLSHEFICRIPYFQKDSSELKKWTIRENAKTFQTERKPIPRPIFIVPLPEIREKTVPSEVKPIDADSMREIVNSSFPCPAKFRYKYADMAMRRPEVSV